MAGKITLTITADAKKNAVFVFDQHDTLLFGRMADCHVCLPGDLQVSRHHFILEVNPPYARIRDLGSRNGIYINRQKYGGREKHETPEEGFRRRYPQADLHDGDEIRVGETILHIKVEAVVSPPSDIRCRYCGKNAPPDIGTVRYDGYVCITCSLQIQADPGVRLQALLQQAQQAAQVGADIHIPDFQIERKLGEGGMGAVYLVRHTRQTRLVALKVMLARVAVDDNARNMFLREIEITRTLRHEYIVELLDNGVTGSLFYFLLEYCDGGSVADLMKSRGGRLTLEEVGPLLLQALEGLAFAHKQGFVHRDLKPQNILLARREKGWIAKIADLGLAKNFEKAGLSGMTATGDGFAGSYPFMPREQVVAFKYVKPTCDIWSMGAVSYHMLTGHYPRHQLREQDPLDVILQGEIIPIHQRDAQIPAPVAEVIDRSLRNEPQDRYQNASDMRKALAKALGEAKK